MTPLSQQSTMRLQNRVNAILEMLRADHPHEIGELVVLLNVLSARAQNPEGPLAMIRMPSTAVMMLMTELAEPMSKKQIYGALVERGFAIESSTKKALVNDAINHLIERGELERVSGERGDTIVQIPTAKVVSKRTK